MSDSDSASSGSESSDHEQQIQHAPVITKKKKRKNKKDPRAPKKPLSAFMYFSQQQRKAVQEAHPDATFGQLGKMMGERWKALPAQEKAKYEELNRKDKIRYNEEMRTYVPPPDLEESNKKRKKDGPKKTRSAYLYFQQEVQPQLKKEFPDMKFGDVAKETGKRWKALTEAQKAPYRNMQKADKERYSKELADHNRNNPPESKKKGSGDSGAKQPKKTRSAYLYFQQEVQPQLKKEFPQMSFGDVAKETAKRWKALTEGQKVPYQELQRADKDRYQKEMDEYNRLNPKTVAHRQPEPDSGSDGDSSSSSGSDSDDDED